MITGHTVRKILVCSTVIDSKQFDFAEPLRLQVGCMQNTAANIRFQCVVYARDLTATYGACVCREQMSGGKRVFINEIV